MSDNQEMVNHPKHYNSHPAGIECIDVIEWLPFNVGTAMKYLWRCGLKPGVDVVEDLSKAKWYIDREIKRLEDGSRKETTGVYDFLFCGLPIALALFLIVLFTPYLKAISRNRRR